MAGKDDIAIELLAEEDREKTYGAMKSKKPISIKSKST